MKNILKLIFIPLAISAPAAFGAKYYWADASGTTARSFADEYWSSSQDILDPASAPGLTNITAEIYRMNGLTAQSTVSITDDISWKSLVNDTTSSGSWYMHSAASTISLDLLEQSSSTSNITIRKTQSGLGPTVAAKQLKVTAGVLSLGLATDRYFIKNVTFGDAENPNATSVDINGGSVSIYSTQFVNYGNINISNGALGIFKGKYETLSGLPWSGPNVTIAAGNTVTLGDGGAFRFGAYNNPLDSSIDISKVVARGSSNAVSDTAYSQLLLYSSIEPYGEGEDKRYPVRVRELVIGQTLSEEKTVDNSRLEMKFSGAVHIDSITSENIGGVDTGTKTRTDSNQGLYIYNYSNADITVGSMNVAFSSIELANSTNLIVEGDFTHFWIAAAASHIPPSFRISANSSFTVKGEFINNGVILFDTSATAGMETNVSFGGIGGGLNDARYRITTSSSTAKGNTIITLTGAGRYTYTGRLHDMGQNNDPSTFTSAALSIVKVGSGIQYFRGANYYRGDTIVRGGELHIAAEIGNNGKGTFDWALGRVSLEDGAISATGYQNTSEVGQIDATSFDWSNGKIIVDVDGAEYDRIVIAGALTKTAAAPEIAAKFEIEFRVSGYQYGMIYDIMTFQSASGFSIDDFDVSIIGDNVPEDVRVLLSFNSDNTILQGMFIPEPAEWAALFGLFALLIALRRRRKK